MTTITLNQAQTTANTSNLYMTQMYKFKQINRLIKEYPDFQNKLISTSDQETWIKNVIQFCEEKGISVTSEEVNEQINSRLKQLQAKGQLRPMGEIFMCTAKTSPF